MLDVTRLRVMDAVARHGSVTAAAKELHYSQPSVSHHLARLEAETGAQLVQRVGRGIRLTEAGRLLADRAAEIIGRIEAADAELTAHVGLTAGRVRLAGFSSAIGSLAPLAAAALAGRHPGLQISLIDTHPPEALELLRAGKVDVAIIFRYDETEPEPDGVHLHHLLDDPVYLLSPHRGATLAALRDATWIAGCDRCRSHLLSLCADQGYEPKIGYTSDDMVVMQTLVAAGLGSDDHPRAGAASSPRRGHRRDRAAGLAPARLRRDLRRAARHARRRSPARGTCGRRSGVGPPSLERVPSFGSRVTEPVQSDLHAGSRLVRRWPGHVRGSVAVGQEGVDAVVSCGSASYLPAAGVERTGDFGFDALEPRGAPGEVVGAFSRCVEREATGGALRERQDGVRRPNYRLRTTFSARSGWRPGP
jgi:DNA-binding transcriptional LysR family regulator